MWTVSSVLIDTLASLGKWTWNLAKAGGIKSKESLDRLMVEIGQSRCGHTFTEWDWFWDSVYLACLF